MPGHTNVVICVDNTKLQNTSVQRDAVTVAAGRVNFKTTLPPVQADCKPYIRTYADVAQPTHTWWCTRKDAQK